MTKTLSLLRLLAVLAAFGALTACETQPDDDDSAGDDDDSAADASDLLGADDFAAV